MQRRDFLGLALATLMPVSEQTLEVKAGDIFLTRNAGGEQFNQSPGYYNHTAILATGNWTIEAQETPDRIIAVPVWYFFERYPEVLVLRPKDSSTAIISAQYAFKMIGRNYTKLESIRPLWRWHSGDNCVTTIRRIYNQITGIDHKWRIPDHFLSSPIFKSVALKHDYDNYQPPQEQYKGMITYPPKGPAK